MAMLLLLLLMMMMVMQAHREGGVEGRNRVSYPGPRDIWGPRRRSEI